ncbi:MAG: dTDP-4-dehydrorhamnose reductase [Draconibacterium sp.]|nr:MAG: dTDP-4-dehydrorhamnose reductase [Draconibacterium sp.]
MKILVTGAYGQLGNEIEAISKDFKQWKFVFTDVDKLDITDETAVGRLIENEQPDFLVNCAAYTGVDKAETDKEAAFKVNTLAPRILARQTKKVNARMIHISTDYVFNGKGFRPYSETDATMPLGVYGKTKLEGEQNCLRENHQAIIIRTSWLYSAYGNNFVKTMLRLGNERDKLNVVFDQVGSPTYAGDLALIVLEIIHRTEIESDSFIPGIYHYSNEGVASWYDFAKAIFEFSGLQCDVFPVLSEAFPTVAKRPNYSVLDKTKIKTTFHCTIPYWKESLRRCIQKI